MSYQFPPGQNSAKDDFVVPESGPGEEAANFSADEQRTEFLGGGSEKKPATEKYLPDQKLTREQKRTERDNIVRGFGDIIRGDNQIPSEFMAEYPDYAARDSGQSFTSSTLSLKRGAGEYFISTIPLGEQGRRYALSLRRTEGDIGQTLTVSGPDDPTISYNEFDGSKLINDTTGTMAAQHRNIDYTGLAINKGMELLAKVKEDFKTPAGNEPVEFKQEQPPTTPTEASRSFLERTVQTIKRDWPAYLSWGGLIGAGGTFGGFENSIVGDFAQGNFKSLAARGAIVALSSMPEGIRYLKRHKAYKERMAQEVTQPAENP